MILIIEDNHDFQELVATYLDAGGYRFVVFSSAAESLAHFAELAPPALVICDPSSPRQRSTDLLTLIKGHPGWQDVPIVVFSLDPYLRAPSVKSGAAAFIIKGQLKQRDELLLAVAIHLE